MVSDRPLDAFDNLCENRVPAEITFVCCVKPPFSLWEDDEAYQAAMRLVRIDGAQLGWLRPSTCWRARAPIMPGAFVGIDLGMQRGSRVIDNADRT